MSYVVEEPNDWACPFQTGSASYTSHPPQCHYHHHHQLQQDVKCPNGYCQDHCCSTLDHLPTPTHYHPRHSQPATSHSSSHRCNSPSTSCCSHHCNPPSTSSSHHCNQMSTHHCHCHCTPRYGAPAPAPAPSPPPAPVSYPPPAAPTAPPPQIPIVGRENICETLACVGPTETHYYPENWHQYQNAKDHIARQNNGQFASKPPMWELPAPQLPLTTGPSPPQSQLQQQPYVQMPPPQMPPPQMPPPQMPPHQMPPPQMAPHQMAPYSARPPPVSPHHPSFVTPPRPSQRDYDEFMGRTARFNGSGMPSARPPRAPPGYLTVSVPQSRMVGRFRHPNDPRAIPVVAPVDAGGYY